MSSQPLTDLQLFFLFQVPFTFFLSFPLLFPNLLFFSVSLILYFSHLPPLFFRVFIVVCYGISASQVFLLTLSSPIFSFPPAALRGFGKPFSLPGGVLWLVLALALLSPAQWGACRNEWSSGAKLLSRLSPVLVQLSWGGVERLCGEAWLFQSLCAPLCYLCKKILTSLDKYGFELWSILSIKRLARFFKWEAPKTFCLACMPFTLCACCKSWLCPTLMVVMINLLFCWAPIPRNSLFIVQGKISC